MSNKIKSNVYNFKLSIIQNIKTYKKFYLLGLLFIFLGLILSINGISNYIENNANCLSLIGLIKNSELNILIYEIKILIYPILFPIIVAFCCVNYYLCIVSFCSITIYSYFFFRYIITSIFIEPLLGLISFFIFYLPIIFILYFGFITFFTKILELTLFNCKKKFKIIPYSCNFNNVKKYVKKYLSCVCLPILIYANAIIIILFLIF